MADVEDSRGLELDADGDELHRPESEGVCRQTPGGWYGTVQLTATDALMEIV